MNFLKKLIKSSFHSMGYSISQIEKENNNTIFSKFRGSSSEELMHMKRLGFNPNLIIDLGAANGESPFLYIFPESEYIWVEPCEEFKPSLEGMKQKYKGDFIIAAAGEKVSETDIHVYEGFYGSSLLETTDQEHVKAVVRRVPMVSVDSIVSEQQLSKGNIILKADVQGYELNVLKGAEKVLQQCEAIFLETCLFDTFSGGGDLTEIIIFLNEKGFKPYAFVDGSNRPADQALFQIDVFFVKENGFFRKTNRWAENAQYEKWKS
jgi:FkbM family methyltransferase